MRSLSDFIQGKDSSNTYILVGFFGSIIIGFFVYDFHMEYLYSASSSDHFLLLTILNKGALLLVISLAFSLVLYSALWLYKRGGGSWSFTLITLACAHFLVFTILSTLVIGANTYRAADGLITKEHKPLMGVLDD